MLPLLVVILDGRVVILEMVDLVVEVMADLPTLLQVWLLLMAFHPRHRVTLVVLFLVLGLAVLAEVDGEVQDLLPVAETEIKLQQHLEILQIHLAHLVLVVLSTLLVAAEQVNIKRVEFLVDMGVAVMVVTPVVQALELQHLVPRTPEVVEVVEDLTTLVLQVTADLV